MVLRELSEQSHKFDIDVTDDATGRQSQNVRLFGLAEIGEQTRC